MTAAALTAALVSAAAFALSAPAAAAPVRVSAATIAPTDAGYLGWHFQRGTATNAVGGLVIGATGDTYVLNGAVAAGTPGLATSPDALGTLITGTSFEGSGQVILQFPYSVTETSDPSAIVAWGTLRTAGPIASGATPTTATPFVSSRLLGTIPANTERPLSDFLAELTTLDASYDVRQSGQGFWASQQTPAAVVSTFTSGGTTTTFGMSPLTVTPATSTVTVTAADIRPDADPYAGWHEGASGAPSFAVDATGLHLGGGTTASQIINGLAAPAPVATLDDLVALVGSYAVDVTSGEVHTQLPFFFGAGEGFTTLRTNAPIPTGGFTPALDQIWTTSRDLPATATTPAVARNSEVPLSTLLDALAAQGNVRALAFGVYASPAASPAVVASVTFQSTRYVFGVATSPSTEPTDTTPTDTTPTDTTPSTEPTGTTPTGTTPTGTTPTDTTPSGEPSAITPTPAPTEVTPTPGVSASAAPSTTTSASSSASPSPTKAALPATGANGATGLLVGAAVVIALGAAGVLTARRMRAGA